MIIMVFFSKRFKNTWNSNFPKSK